MKNSLSIRPPLLFLAAALACASCGTPQSNKVMLEIPGPAAVNPDKIEALFLTNFWLAQEVKGLDLNKELKEFWTGELAVHFKGPIQSREVRFDKDGLFADASFWKELAGGAPRTLILTGRVSFAQETRKALLEVEKGVVGEPFTKEKTWDVRRNFTLEARLYFIAADTGLVVKDKEYKETVTYPNPKQPTLFALHDLLQRLKMKFFRDSFGAPRLQERYLLGQ
jgi:hypothetical protein